MDFNTLWQKIHEAINLFDPQLESQIRFTSKYNNTMYLGKWKIDNIKYTATSVKQDMKIPHTNLPMNAFGILFEAQGEDNTPTVNITGQAGPKATTIYNGLLIFIRKVVEAQEKLGTPIQAFKFSAMEPEMMPIYERFFRMFLADKFVRYDDKLIISKDTISQMKSQNPEQSADIDMQIQSAHEKQQREIENIKKVKAKQRFYNRN